MCDEPSYWDTPEFAARIAAVTETHPAGSPALNQPIRSRTEAALDIARTALKCIANSSRHEDARFIAAAALAAIQTLGGAIADAPDEQRLLRYSYNPW